MKCLVPLLATIAASSSLAAESPNDKRNPAGLWLGTFNIGPIRMRVAFKIEIDGSGNLSGFVNVIDQNDAEIQFDNASFADGTLRLSAGDGSFKFAGKLDAAGRIDGTFEQGILSFPLRLDRIDKMPEPRRRPQTPKPPFPYPTHEVVFENPRGKFDLAGTLVLPAGDGPFPAVVLISGSGPQDRDETVFGHKPLLVLADHFARNGIASLRYNDRGVGKSKGKFPGSTTKNFAEDAEAAFEFLKTQKKIDPKRIGVCGHSEGGTAAPMVAVARPEDVKFVILLAATGFPGEKIFADQVKYSGLAGDLLAEPELPQFTQDMLAIIKSDCAPADLESRVRAALEKLAETKKPRSKEKVDRLVASTSRRLSDPWLRWFAAYDPATSLRKLTCPILAINGSKDVQSLSKPNLDAIRTATAANKRVTVIEFPGLNHLFQKCKTGEFSEYNEIEETISPEVLDRLTDWIKRLD